MSEHRASDEFFALTATANDCAWYVKRGWSHCFCGASRENFSAARQSFEEAALQYSHTASVSAGAALMKVISVVFGWSAS
jgi:hypothetical protein